MKTQTWSAGNVKTDERERHSKWLKCKELRGFTRSLVFFSIIFSFLFLLFLLHWSLFHLFGSLITYFRKCFFKFLSLILIGSVLRGTNLCKPFFWCLFIGFTLIGQKTVFDELFLQRSLKEIMN